MKRRDCLRLTAQMVAAGSLPLWMNAAGAAEEGPLPLEFFARRPLLEDAVLSPDGKYIAAVANNGKESMVVVRLTEGGDFEGLVGTDNLQYTINWIQWINNERLAISMAYPANREEAWIGRFATTESRLFAINRDGSNLLNLVKRKSSASTDLKWAIDQDQVVDWLPNDGQHILLALPSSERFPEPSVQKVNVYTAERTTYADRMDDVWSWRTDQSHRVRIGLGRTESGEYTVWVCNPDGSNWRLINKTPAFSAETLWPLGFGLDPNILYVTALHEGLDAVFTLDLRDLNAKPQLKLAHPRYSLGGSLIHDERGEAVGIRKLVLGDSSSFYWDERYRQMQQDMDAALPNRFNALFNKSRDGKTFIATSDAPGEPERFLLVRFGDAPSVKLLAHAYPELAKQKIAVKERLDIKARDGLVIPSFLSFPPRVPEGKRKGLPLVVLPHGGPEASDSIAFDPISAFLADRGYLVVQPNFRGSTGYGQAHLEAGLRRWGLQMQEDLEDSVAELVRKGLADPARVAIVGGSYGGYAALMGLIKTPDLYRCGFAIAPVTDLLDFAEDRGQNSNREGMRRRLGDARDDRERLRATSPCYHADRITKPVYIVHGTLDRAVPYRHATKMVEALKAAGKPHVFVSQDKGDHYMSHLPYRQQIYSAMETFLAQHLKA